MKAQDRVGRFLAAVIDHANGTNDPRADRLALIASDLIGKAKATEDGDLRAWATATGYPGPAASKGGSAPERSIAADVLKRAQTSIDGDDPDPAAITAGLQAARRLIAANSDPGHEDLRLWIAYGQLGLNPYTTPGSPWFRGVAEPGNMLAPDHLVTDVYGLDDMDGES